MELDDYLDKLERVLQQRKNLYVIARTDAVDEDEALHRARAIAATGADAILVDAIKDLAFVTTLSKETGRPIVFNQIAGGKSPPASLTELHAAGVSIANYSTPCLFAAQEAVNNAMLELKQSDGRLTVAHNADNTVHGCTDLLKENLHFRKKS